jgi:hypothetical protein
MFKTILAKIQQQASVTAASERLLLVSSLCVICGNLTESLCTCLMQNKNGHRRSGR